jgi:hypothetical protein
MDKNCERCRFFVPEPRPGYVGPGGLCHWWPEPSPVQTLHWCGQFQALELAPELKVKAKAKG